MFKNSEVKKYTITYLIVIFLIGVALYLLIRLYIHNVDEEYYHELITATSGTTHLEDTGRDKYMPSEYSSAVKTSFYVLYGGVYGIFFILSVIGYFLGLRLYKTPMIAIAKVTDNSKEVLEGNYDSLQVADITEGDISQFYSIYTKMVTAIKQSKDKEQQEKIFLQDLIADISHQLKTPLATLSIYQDLLLNNNVSAEKKQEMLKLMGAQLSRMEWLILSLLKLARLESGSIVFTMKQEPLLPTLQMSIQNVDMLRNEKHQTISLSCPPDITLYHDKDWLGEALTNILKNATEYAPPNSNIEVWVEQTQVMTMIHIKDYGKGIEPESQNKIFKRFYRAKSNVNENSIGIGLSLSKSIVEGQGGDITLSSEVGKYTCFTLNFYSFK